MAIMTPNRRASGAGFSMQQDPNGLLRLTFNEGARRALYCGLKDLAVYTGDEPIVIAQAMTRVGEAIGSFGVETLIRIAAGEIGEGVTVFDGLPFEAVEWAPYPGMPARSAKSTSLSEALLLGLGGYMGEPYGVASEGDRLINELIPSVEDLARNTGNGSRLNLGLHRENAAPKFLSPGIDFSPKALMLTGVSEQVAGGPTTPVAICARAVSLLEGEDQAVLRGPSAFLQVPERWRNGGDAIEIGPVPVILGGVGREQVAAAFYGGLTRAADPAAAAALAKLQAALELVAIPLRVTPGHMVHLANGRVLHGRSDFEPEFSADGRARRWLQRIFLAGRLEDFRTGADPRERVFDLAATARGLAGSRGA